MQKVKVQITLAEKSVEVLERISEEKGVSKSSVIALALDLYFRNIKKEGGKTLR